MSDDPNAKSPTPLPANADGIDWRDGFFNLFSLFFAGLGILGFVAGIGAFVYNIWTYFMGDGSWLTTDVLMTWLFGPSVLSDTSWTQIISMVIRMLPLEVALCGIGWLLYRLSEILEDAS